MAEISFLKLLENPWYLLPAFIFLARVTDVSVGTLRIIFMTKGKKLLAALLGFTEILIWLFAISQIFQNLTNIYCFIAYAGGYATGTYVGIFIENKLALGMQIMRIVTRRDATKLVTRLKSEGYGTTIVNAEGAKGPVKIIFSIIKRKDLKYLIKLINQYNPQAVFSVEDIRLAEQAALRDKPSFFSPGVFNYLKFQRKGK